MGLTKPRAYQIYDLDYKQSVRVVTVTNVTLTGGAPSLVDGVSLSLDDRVLVTGQSAGSQNGIYYVTTVGSGSNGTWARSIDTNETGELDAGTIVMVTEGTVYADTQWKLTTDDPIVIGSTALTFVQNYSTNSITSGTSNVVVTDSSNVSIAVSGSNVVVFSAGTQNITANIIPTANVTYNLGNATNRFNDLYLANNSIFLGNVTLAATGTDLTVNGATVVTASGSSTLSLSGNITGGNLISNGLISATGNITGGNIITEGNITGNYILGNGALLTGVITSVANINSGTSNVTVVSPDGDITVGVGGTSNIAVFSNAGQDVSGYLTATGNVSGGNLNTVGQITAIGNITGNYFIGNGSQLTGIAAGDTIGGNITILTRDSGNVNFAVTAGYVSILTRASGNVSFPLAA